MRWWNGVSWSDTYQRGREQSQPAPDYSAAAPSAARAPGRAVAPPAYTVAPPAYGPNSSYPASAMPPAPAPAPPLGFGAAIASVFRQYAGFVGVATRSEFWYFALFAILVRLALVIPDIAIASAYDLDSGPLMGLWTLGVLLPSLAVGVRRLRDAGYAWGWIFIGLLPIVGTIILTVMLASASRPPRPTAMF